VSVILVGMPAPLNFGVYLYLFWVIVLMPVSGVWSWYRLRSGKPLPPKEKRYRAMVVFQVWIFLLTLVVMQDNGIHLFAYPGPPLWGWCVATGYMALLWQRVKVGWQRISDERKEKARRLLPENPAHLRYWIPISLLAGLSEECAFRGLAFVLLARLLGGPVPAMAVCVIAFGVAHMMQGWRGVLGTSIIALVMHGLVYLTGGLYLPIAVHAAYDLIVGFVAIRAFTQYDSQTLAQSQGAN
jgi:membrane protease YdiL (CAAX protease family)